MKTTASRKLSALLVIVAVCGGIIGQTDAFAQPPTNETKTEQDQRYLIYVKGIT